MRVFVSSLVLLVLFLWSCEKSKQESEDSEDAYSEYEIADPSISKSESRSGVHTVEIMQMKFVPDVLNVHKGDTIVWINKDIVEHDVTDFIGKAWTSTRLPAGGSWKMAVTSSQSYFCSLHVVMKGKIIVDGNDIAMLDGSSEISMCD